VLPQLLHYSWWFEQIITGSILMIVDIIIGTSIVCSELSCQLFIAASISLAAARTGGQSGQFPNQLLWPNHLHVQDTHDAIHVSAKMVMMV